MEIDTISDKAVWCSQRSRSQNKRYKPPAQSSAKAHRQVRRWRLCFNDEQTSQISTFCLSENGCLPSSQDSSAGRVRRSNNIREISHQGQPACRLIDSERIYTGASGPHFTVEKSINAVVAILGVLVASGAFLPLEPENPRERNLGIVEDLEGKIAITDQYTQISSSELGTKP